MNYVFRRAPVLVFVCLQLLCCLGGRCIFISVAVILSHNMLAEVHRAIQISVVADHGDGRL